jgi:uncharacterized protein YneF (UPF0154 family)
MPQTLIPILSLVVAVIAAVFVGLYVSWRVAQRQFRVNLAIATKQLVAPMRQAWINNFRDVVRLPSTTRLLQVRRGRR